MCTALVFDQCVLEKDAPRRGPLYGSVCLAPHMLFFLPMWAKDVVEIVFRAFSEKGILETL